MEKELTGKTVKESAIIMAQIMTPLDANNSGNVHGGVVMKLIDTAAGVVSARHAGVPAVTASVDRLDFHHPIYIGELLTVKASLNLVGKTSMEVGVRVEAENLFTGEKRHTASAYLTMVAMGKDRKPISVPPLILETEEEFRRNRQAQSRREVRLREKKSEE